MEHYFDFDAPLFRTIKGMITKPGKIIREYIHGKRKSYAHPFRFYVLILAMYIIVQQLISFDPISTFSEILGAREAPNPDTAATKGSYFYARHINIFMLIYAFTLSLFSRLFFRKSGFHYAEYLALAFFVIAEYVFINTFIMLGTLISPYFFVLNYLLVLIYPIYVLLSFHQQYNFRNILKAIATSIFAWVLYVLSGQALAILIIKLFNL
ncbi:DUF3667 domain-containing protein [Gracilimonas sp.]|uniref:DUF3667 domain-containing protein n=1 Tax=Gracilimonas sp. TaxID=1974203 RepID=UPI0032EEA044